VCKIDHCTSAHGASNSRRSATRHERILDDDVTKHPPEPAITPHSD
jgi:hypothetical protein